MTTGRAGVMRDQNPVLSDDPSDQRGRSLIFDDRGNPSCDVSDVGGFVDFF